MRQVGKTTILKMIYNSIKSPNKVFLDLENPINQEIFLEKDYDNIWSNLKNLFPESLASMSKDLKLKENYVVTKKYSDKKGFIPVTEV